jgi:hypothetical protein
MLVLITVHGNTNLITAAGALDFLNGRLFRDIAVDAGHLLAGILRGGVHFHQLQNVELGLLQDLHLADEAVLKREDGLACLNDVLADRLWDKLADDFLEVTLGALNDDFAHLLADGTDLSSLCVARLFGLVLPLHGESDNEDAEGVAIRGADVNVALNKGLPLLDEGAQFVAGHFHAVEVADAVVALDIVAAQLDLAEGLVLVVVKISKGRFEDAALQLVGGDFLALCLGDQSLASLTHFEVSRDTDGVPLLLEEDVLCLLLAPLLGLGQSLVLSDSHGC